MNNQQTFNNFPFICFFKFQFVTLDQTTLILSHFHYYVDGGLAHSNKNCFFFIFCYRVRLYPTLHSAHQHYMDEYAIMSLNHFKVKVSGSK